MTEAKDLSRRNFLRKASLVSGGALMTGSQLWANENI
ncbi:MAG: twin-arginine translocation signal domain-containing protein, partial [Gammaproteobacteria bacterium]